MPRFADRLDAGRFLARHLLRFENRPDVLVLGLPRGGVPVAFEVALALDAPLEVFVVRKLGVPGREELAFGAIASGGARVVNPETVRLRGLTEDTIERVARAEERELARRERLYRGTRPPPRVAGRTAMLVDDGLATGASMRVAVAALRSESPARVVVAVPIAPTSTCEELAREVDEIVCAATPEPFLSVGAWYEDFSQTSDDEVRELLERAARRHGGLRSGGPPPAGAPS
jgi:putative phosphoribosyl transferase